MAIKDGKFIRGPLGPYLFRVVNGVQVISLRPEPGTIKQTENTKSASGIFGMAASLGLAIRTTLSPLLSGFYDGAMPNRLAKALGKSLRSAQPNHSTAFGFEENSFQNLTGLEFNRQSQLDGLLHLYNIRTELQDQLIIRIVPSDSYEDVKFPAKTYKCTVIVSVSVFNLKAGERMREPESQTVIVTKDQSHLKEQTFNFDVPAGCLCIATIFLKYAEFRQKDLATINYKRFNPGAIIGAFITPGAFKNKEGRLWMKMRKIGN